MNYIPGFSNYLDTSVPRYADGGAVTDTVPYDLSGLDLSGLNNLYGMNFGSDFGGGAMGGQYQTDPNLQYIGAPTSNKGNATGRSAGNTFTMTPDQPVRLVDLRTNQIVFEGTGYDAARKATELGQNLTDTLGRKANYDIQTADPSGVYTTVANEKKNKSTLGEIANVAGTVLPMAVSLIPGLQFLGPVLSQVAAAGAGAALKGQDPLKAAALAGLTAGAGNVLGPTLGTVGNMGLRAGTAVGTGLGAVAGGLATGQNLKNSLLGGVASGALSYAGPTIQNSLGINPASSSVFKGSPSISADGYTGLTVTGGGTTLSPNFTLGGSPNKIQQALAEKPYDGLTVTGDRIGNAFGVDLGGNQFGAPGQDQSAFEKMYSEPYDPNEILVKATPTTQPTPVSVPVTSGLSPDVLAGMAEFEKNPIISEGSKIEQPTPVSVPVTSGLPTDIVVNALGKEKGLPEGSVLADIGIPQVPAPDPALTKKPLGLEEYLRLASLASGLIGGAAGSGSGQTGTYTRGGGSLNPIFSAKLPSAGGLGTIGASRTVRPMSDEDWLTYGTRPEKSFFDYAPQATTALPTPITTPVPNEPAAPAMYVPDDMRFAEGGAFAAKHGGQSHRTEFAVNGPGTGRSDDIPAVLSDGEYVMDAETVALLGDGSSKAGAKKLDELRVKVRKHKGEKLAKGRFSANAKKPEAYLSGGRI